MNNFWFILAAIAHAFDALKLPRVDFQDNGEMSFFVPLSVIEEIAADYIEARRTNDGATLETIADDFDVEIMLHFEGDEVDSALSGMSADIGWNTAARILKVPSSANHVTPEELVAYFMTRLFECPPLHAHQSERARWGTTLALRRTYPGMNADYVHKNGTIHWRWEASAEAFGIAFLGVPHVVLNVLGGSFNVVEAGGDDEVVVLAQAPDGTSALYKAPDEDSNDAWQARLEEFNRHMQDTARQGIEATSTALDSVERIGRPSGALRPAGGQKIASPA